MTPDPITSTRKGGEDSEFAPGFARPPFAVAGVAANLPKHTPGPWQVSGGRRSDALYGHGVGPDGGGYVAMVTYSDRTAADHLASLADARLIASAPEMLDALKAWSLDHSALGRLTVETAAKMRAAISKAEGRDQ